MDYIEFEECFNALEDEEKIKMFNEYCEEYGDSSECMSDFDEEFFDINFTSPMDAARALFFGKVKSWIDPYIRLNVHGNLESFSKTQAAAETESYISDIYEHKDIWSKYIGEEEE